MSAYAVSSLFFNKAHATAVLQIRRGIRDNLGITIHISIFCDPSLEPSHQDLLIRGHNIRFC